MRDANSMEFDDTGYGRKNNDYQVDYGQFFNYNRFDNLYRSNTKQMGGAVVENKIFLPHRYKEFSSQRKKIVTKNNFQKQVKATNKHINNNNNQSGSS